MIKNVGERPEIEFTYFVPDRKKEGGRYELKRGKVCRIDEVSREIIFVDRTVINMDRVLTYRVIFSRTWK